jgi:hypothetical protein
MQQVTDFDRRVANAYDIIDRVTSSYACQWFELGKWGIQNRDKQMHILQDLGALFLYMAMLEWKALEYNTYYAEFDNNGCAVWKYPGDFVDQETLKCITNHFVCNGIDVRTMLKRFGIGEPGVKPDGIDYMHIEQGNPPCDNRLFQIDKPYGTDFI